jgi:hypothetical protein
LQQSVRFDLEMQQLNLMIGLVNGSHQVNEAIALCGMTRTVTMLRCANGGGSFSA